MLFCIDKAEDYFNKKAPADAVGVKPSMTGPGRPPEGTDTVFLNLTAFHCYYPSRKLVEAKPIRGCRCGRHRSAAAL